MKTKFAWAGGLALGAAIIIVGAKAVRATDCAEDEKLVGGVCRKVVYQKVTEIDFEDPIEVSGDYDEWVFGLDGTENDETGPIGDDTNTTGGGSVSHTGDNDALFEAPGDTPEGALERKEMIRPMIALVTEAPPLTFKCDEYLYKIRKMRVDGQTVELKKLRKSRRARNKFRTCIGLMPEQWEKWGRKHGYLPEPTVDPELAWLFEEDDLDVAGKNPAVAERGDGKAATDWVRHLIGRDDDGDKGDGATTERAD